MYNSYDSNYSLYAPYNHYRASDTKNIKLQNLGESNYRNLYLDINGNNGGVILSYSPTFSGTNWRLTDNGHGIIMLQNLGQSPFKNFYLDIDGNSGRVILSRCLFSGVYWKLNDLGDGTIRLQNLGHSNFRNQYLDTDNQGNLIVSAQTYSGTRWLMTQ